MPPRHDEPAPPPAPAEKTPAAQPERPPEASTPEVTAIPQQHNEPSPPPAPATPTSESPAEPPVPASPSADPIATPAVEPSRKLEVVARLVEPKHTAGCGVLHMVVVMRYEIIDVLEGTYGERELYAAHSCPEMGTDRCRDVAGKAVAKFKAGDVHHLRLDQRSRGGSLIDLFTDKHLPRYRVTCGNLVPRESP